MKELSQKQQISKEHTPNKNKQENYTINFLLLKFFHHRLQYSANLQVTTSTKDCKEKIQLEEMKHIQYRQFTSFSQFLAIKSKIQSQENYSISKSQQKSIKFESNFKFTTRIQVPTKILKQLTQQYQKLQIVRINSYLKAIVKWTDRWKCQCLMMQELALWMDTHKFFQKSLQILTTIISFLTLFLSVLSLRGESQILIYRPFNGHFLLTSLQNVPPQQALEKNCHYFDTLAHVKYVGFDRLLFYQIRIVVLFVLWIVDMLGLFFSFVHPSCGTKLYVFGLVITLFFFVLFPSEFCINFGNDCIQNSPILFIYRIEFMIQFNVAWFGIGAIGLIVIIYPINYLARQYCNICLVGDIFFDTIYGIVCIPFFVIAIINFVTALWTSSAIINSLTLASTVINYLLYHSSTTVRKQLIKRQKQVKKIRENLPKNQEDFNFQFNQILVDNNHKSQEMNSVDQLEIGLKKNHFLSPQKPDRMQFYREWQNRLQREFHET